MRIQDGAFGTNTPLPPHLVEEPAMLLIKIGTNLCQAKISLSTHENNMYILLQIYLKPKRTKVKLTVKLSSSNFIHTKLL